MIEVGEYVRTTDGEIQIETNNQGKYIYYINDDIESIVTKEMMKSVEYRIN